MAASLSALQSQAICLPHGLDCSTPIRNVAQSHVYICTASWTGSRMNEGNCQVTGGRGHLGTRLTFVDSISKRRHLVLKVEAAKKVSSGRSFVLSSTLVIEEGNEDKVTKLCENIRSWGEAKQKENSGLELFEVNVDLFDKNVYHFWERYTSFMVMNDIRASPEHTKFMSDVRPFLKSPIGLAVYEYKDGQIGHMMNPIGPKGEGGLDDATGQSGMKQQSSTIYHGIGDTHEERGSWGLDKMLAKIRGEVQDTSKGWNIKTLFGGEAKK